VGRNGLIPRSIHFIHLNDAPPEPLLQACINRARAAHPGWTFRMHTGPDGLFAHPALAAVRGDLETLYDRVSRCTRRSPYIYQADLIRLCALYAYGGFYLDTDIWVVRPLDRFLLDRFVVGYINDRPQVGEAVIGVPSRSPLIMSLITGWIANPPTGPGASMGMTTWAQDNRIPVYPTEVFVPHARDDDGSGLYYTTRNTHTIHLWHREFKYDLRRLRQIADNASHSPGRSTACPTSCSSSATAAARRFRSSP
jgi:hypothetical protein